MERNITPAIIVGALVALLLQLIVAPNMVIFNAMPNFILAFVLVIAVLKPSDSIMVLAFILGFLSDLIGYGPLGAMSFLLVLSVYLIMRVFTVIDRDNLFMTFIVLLVSIVAIELIYTLACLALGYASGFFDALIYRALPSILLDSILTFLMYLIFSRVFSGRNTQSLPSSSEGFRKPKRNSRSNKRYR